MKGRWKKFFSYYKPYKKLFYKDMLCAMIASAITLVFPILTRYITGTILANNNPDVTHIYMIGGFMLVLVGIEYICNYFIGYMGHVMGVYMERDLRNELFNHYQKLSFRFYDEQNTGQLMSRLTNDLFSLTELYHHGPEDIVISLIKFIGAFILLSLINVKLTLILFAILPFMFLFAWKYNVKMKRAYKRNREKIGDINERIEDNLLGIRVVKSFANEDEELIRFDKENSNYVASKKNSYYYMGGYHAGLTMFTSLITVSVIFFGTLFISHHSIDIPDLIAFLLYITNLIDPVKKLLNFTEQFQEGITGFERFMEVLEIEPDIIDQKNAIIMHGINHNICFKNVSFRYDEHLPYVLNHINLDVKAGDYIAFVGSSGVGKTTICSLIPRFYDVTEGKITIDGIDIKQFKQDSLRKNIGIVQQDVYLFTGSIMENIRYGNLNASDEEVIEAAKKANAHDFIMELEDGYDTDCGQRGVKLSGGQKQRISIARVFLKNPPILIFDEATSALDNESEEIVQQSLEKLAHHRTTFVIAHRLSTIKNAKRICVLTDNGIEEQGTHDELMKLNGQYAYFYNMQFSKKQQIL